MLLLAGSLLKHSRLECLTVHTWEPLEARSLGALPEGTESREARPERPERCGACPELVASASPLDRLPCKRQGCSFLALDDSASGEACTSFEAHHPVHSSRWCCT